MPGQRTPKKDPHSGGKSPAPAAALPAPQTPAVEEPTGPRVSVVLVAYNQAAALRRAVEALERSKERERIEILVVDCGSRDESANIDAEFPAVQILRLPQHFGATRAMNIATRTAKAELLFLLSPDVEVLPDTVARLAEKLEGDQNFAAVCPLLVDEAGEPTQQAWSIPSKSDFAAGRLRAAAVDPAQESTPVEYASRDALMVRKQLVRGINYFDERFGEYWADLDLAMQIRRAGKKIIVYPQIRAILHPGEDPLEGDPVAKADFVLGAAEFLGKYEGFAAGFGFRMSAIFGALFKFDFKRFGLLASGEKMGSQAGR